MEQPGGLPVIEETLEKWSLLGERDEENRRKKKEEKEKQNWMMRKKKQC